MKYTDLPIPKVGDNVILVEYDVPTRSARSGSISYHLKVLEHEADCTHCEIEWCSQPIDYETLWFRTWRIQKAILDQQRNLTPSI